MTGLDYGMNKDWKGLNLGCGTDVKVGYFNVDFRSLTGVDLVCDLSKIPWPFDDASVDEILMLDFLEHFPYRQTTSILQECWRILKVGGNVVIQVPDFEHLSLALQYKPGFMCNRCGHKFTDSDMLRADFFVCRGCRQDMRDLMSAAVGRLFGGQDYEGNYHYTTFTKDRLILMLRDAGFESHVFLEEAHQHANWNFKVMSKKKQSLWNEE